MQFVVLKCHWVYLSLLTFLKFQSTWYAMPYARGRHWLGQPVSVLAPYGAATRDEQASADVRHSPLGLSFLVLAWVSGRVRKRKYMSKRFHVYMCHWKSQIWTVRMFLFFQAFKKIFFISFTLFKNRSFEISALSVTALSWLLWDAAITIMGCRLRLLWDVDFEPWRQSAHDQLAAFVEKRRLGFQ